MKRKSSREKLNTKNKGVESRLPAGVPLPDTGRPDGSPGTGKDAPDQHDTSYRLEDALVYPSASSNLEEEADGFVNLDENRKLIIIIQKCECRCVWCPICWELRYVPRLNALMEEMDHKRVRLLTLTIARDKFNTPLEAYKLFRAGEFVSSLSRGKRKRNGCEWTDEYIFKPIQWSRYLWWVEFHRDGTAHFHLVIEVDESGKEGMIGSERLQEYWTYGWIEESYFEDEQHWKNFIGYEAKKGYASADKGHQGILPELLDQVGSKKLRRWGHSRKKEKSEQENFTEVRNYFIRKGTEQRTEEPNRNKKRTYKEIIESCGKQSFVTLCIEEMEFKVIMDKPYREMKASIKGEYIESRGYVGSMTYDEIGSLLPLIVRDISANRIKRGWRKKEYEDVEERFLVTGKRR